MKQDALLCIVQAWNLNPKPEYRGFRCANCQRYIHRSWHHWLNSKGYKTPVHLCQDCEKKSRKGNLKVVAPRRSVVKSKFSFNLSEKVTQELRSIARSWKILDKVVHKSFACDKCKASLYKAYHVWTYIDKDLVEIHFCRSCGDQLFS